jgi:hypothetical protein
MSSVAPRGVLFLHPANPADTSFHDCGIRHYSRRWSIYLGGDNRGTLPTFSLNDCLSGHGLTDMPLQFAFLFTPSGTYPRVSLISIPIVTFIVPWLVDLVLLLRLHAVFPVVTTSRRTIYAVFGPVASVKPIRLGCGIAVFTSWVPTIPPEPTTLYSPSNMRLAHSLFWKVATACSLVDHT